MRPGALAPYETSLVTGGALALATDDGRLIRLETARWLGGLDDADRTVVTRCTGPTLDVGCGPGRFVAALAERGEPCLGVDIAAAAILLTRRAGGPALLRDVFAPLPGEGRWGTVLLMDGNVGIGGDPERLLRRVRALLGEGGRAVVEADPARTGTEVVRARFHTDGRAVGPTFDWARVGLPALLHHAGRAGLSPGGSWRADGRSFAVLLR